VSASASAAATAPVVPVSTAPRAGARGVFHALRRNPSFMLGLMLIALLIVFAVIGRFFVGWNDAFPLSAPPSMPPDGDWIFGTDADGRDLFAVVVYGTLLTLKIGVVAGCLGLGIGTTLAFVAAYHGGWLDVVMRIAVDVLLTIPTLLVLVVIASVIHRSVNTTTMGIIIALLAWREPARQIRSQVLVMREAQYVKLAILNGASALRIIFLEMMPNLLPFLGANLVVAISQAVLASIGLEALGLGAPSEPTLGQTIYWMMNESAFMLGMWWWIIEPIAILIILFVGLFLLTAGLDEIANPRLRRAEA
jgi:peptide/nickel transport system permease protein